MMDGLKLRKPGFRIGASFRVAFSDDGRHLATVGKRVTVWDVAERRRVQSVHPFSYESEVDIAPDGSCLVVKNTRGDVVVLDRESLGEQLRLSGKPYGEGSAIKFSPGGTCLVDGSWAGDLLVRDASSGEVLVHEQVGMVSTLDCTRDRMTWIYTVEGLGLVRRLWPFGETPAVPILRSETRLGTGWGTTLSDDGTLLARSTGRAIETWKVDANGGRPEQVGNCEVPVSGSGYALRWHPEADMLAYAASGVALLLTSEAKPLWWGPGFQYASDVRFSSAGDLLAVGDWSKGAVLPLEQLELLP
jgi:WD40 repeat protein